MKNKFNDELLNFLDNSTTPFSATANMVKILTNMNFIRLDESETFNLIDGQSYYVTRNDSSLIAFRYNKELLGFKMMGAHTDSPTLKVKPNPVIKKNSTIQLGVEPYGGVLFNTWFDRDLSLAGRVTYLNESENIEDAILDLKTPIALIPSLAIHLDKNANKDRTINAQTDIVPLISSGEKFDFEEFLKSSFKDLGITDVSTILSHELSFYDTQKASYVGLNKEFITSARIDNLLSCYVITKALVDSSDNSLIFCSDHEEVGSDSTSGAGGTFLEEVLRRIHKDDEQYFKAMRASLMISCDNAHAIHPNFSSKHDENHSPKINQGVVVKVNANQRYASNSSSIAKFKLAALKADLKIQEFVTRSDMGCGSTIGPITATKLGVETIDVGVPTFAMHSIRESAGAQDAQELYEILKLVSF